MASSSNPNSRDRDGGDNDRSKQWDGKNNNGFNNHNMKEFRNAREYAQALRPWLQNYHQMNNFHSAMTTACHFHHLQNMFQLSNCMFPPLATGTTNASNFQQTHRGTDPYAGRRPAANGQFQAPQQNGNIPVNNDQNQPNNENEGIRMKIPTFWKRVAAELIDFTFLFYIKMFISISLMSEFNPVYLDYMSFVNGDDIIERFNDLDYDRAFAITFEVIALEIINRVLITIFETMCLCRARARGGRATGATPGKRLMGLRVVSCDNIQPIGNNGYVMVSPAGPVSMKNAFLRSVIKNFTIAFFLPACLTLFFFKHNRTAYDVVAHTVVVEEAG